MTSVEEFLAPYGGQAFLDKAVAEAEAGYDLDQLKKRCGRPSRTSLVADNVISVRLTDEELAILDTTAKNTSQSRSEVLRDAINHLATQH